MPAARPGKGNRPRFDVDALRELAGSTVFSRGEVYCRDGKVQILGIESDRVLARVVGTEVYRSILWGRAAGIDGECDCPAFDDWGFCKHLVAVALAVNEKGEGAGGDDALTRIRRYLGTQSAKALVEMVVELAGRDAALFERLELSAATADGDVDALEARLRRAIDSATRTRGFVDYREAGGWAADVAKSLDALDEVARGNAGLGVKLAEHAIDRIEDAIEDIDHSDGHCAALLHHAGEIHAKACCAARPDPVELAGQLFAREMNDDFDTFSGAAQRYAEALGDTGLAEYHRVASEAWAQLPPRVGRSEFSADYWRLAKILDFLAERAGDVQARVAIREKDLSSPSRYLELAEFCLAHGRDADALRRIEEGLWIFEDEPLDERLVAFASQLFAKSGRRHDAEALLWRAFDRSPSLALYRQLRKLCGKEALERALAQLKMPIKKAKQLRFVSTGDLIVELLMDEGMFEAAWTAAREPGVTAHTKELLARASEATHPSEAIEVYAARVEARIGSGGNPAYEDAAKLVARMASLRSAADHAAYVADLKARHHRKRNFVKLLG